MRVQKILPLFVISLALTACGGSGGGGGSKSSSKASSQPVSTSNSSSSVLVSSSSVTSISSSSETTTSSTISSVPASASSVSLSISSTPASVSSVSSSINSTPASVSSVSSSISSTPASVSSVSSSISSLSSSSAPTVIMADMTTGWYGNGSGNTGVSYTVDGVMFAALGDNIGAVFNVPKGTLLEKATIELVVNVSSDFKASGGNLQPVAQVLNTGEAEWGCWAPNSTLGDASDTTITCKISEAGKLNQIVNDTKVGVQVKPGANPLVGTVTIKSVKIILAPPSSSSSSFSYSSYDASVASLKDLKAPEDLEVFPIGVAVGNTDSPSTNILTNTQEQALVEKHFSQMTAGNIMKMNYLHPRNDTHTLADYDFTNADEFVDYAKTKGISIHAHTMFWHSDYQVPDFMKNWTGTSAEFLTTVDEHVTTLVNHFAVSGNVKSWDVVNEALTDDTPSDYRKSPFYIASGNSPEFIERAFKAARAANADVELYYNDYSTENNGAKTDMLITMIDDLQAKNTPITGIGFQMHLYLDYPSIANIKAAMQKVVDRNLKVKITELDVSINNPFSNGWSVSTATPYDGLAQKKRYCEIVEAYKATVPEELRGGITVWGTTDASTWLNSFYQSQGLTDGEVVSWPLLFTPQYGDKPALRGFADALSGNACTNL